MDITNFNNVYCLSSHSCSYSAISSIDGNIMEYATLALGSANISNVEGDIYCILTGLLDDLYQTQ